MKTMENRCVSCGEIIPEGQQVCKACIEKSSRKEPEWKKRLLGIFLRDRKRKWSLEET